MRGVGVLVVVASLYHTVSLKVVDFNSVFERNGLIALIDELEHGHRLHP